jgi:hydrogenase expression/formation protein HypE
MEKTANEAGVKIVAGDTKVAGKGQVDHVFITTTGIGKLQEGVHTSGAFAKPGDAIIVTGDVGRHGCTILLARENLGIEADVKSDCAPLWGTVESMIETTKDIHVIRDATRGGVGTVLYEIAAESKVGVCLDSQAIPVDPTVNGVCGMLGLDPLYLANEGTLVVIAPKEVAPAIVETLHQGKYSKNAAIIGEITEEMPGKVVVTTAIGAQTLLPQPGGELLPRIC